ncbi:siderophore iron transporter mirA [Purpureocillium lavendulum]|uniref:Siderophore iron transporter mirA n=1 Tax=Purpureocillium lavendulum TaxID=1247861 RepID=A0AB34G6S5_9HYPO|nr:siderophore iron transporter mirA [Purpureocillium lavendulum]
MAPQLGVWSNGVEGEVGAVDGIHWADEDAHVHAHAHAGGSVVGPCHPYLGRTRSGGVKNRRKTYNLHTRHDYPPAIMAPAAAAAAAADDDDKERGVRSPSRDEPVVTSTTVALDEKNGGDGVVATDVEARDGGPGGDAVSVHSESSLVQAGVQKAMILKKAWSRTTLLIAFTSLFLTTLIITLSDYSHMVLQPYVTSAFKKHSFMSAAHVVINITRIVAYPIIAKLSDVFGRAEMFTLSIVFQTLSFIVYATSVDIGAYFAAGLFDAIGSTGFGLTQQVFIADATSLINRAFWSTLPESITTIPALYLGSLIGEGFLYHAGWRWSYGAWAIIVPVVAVPLIATMVVLQRRARRHGLVAKSLASVAGCPPGSPMWKKALHLAWTEIDLLGLVLLVAGLSLILIPVSLTGSFNPGRWREGGFIAMLVVGVVCFLCFLVWDIRYAKKPYIPAHMANRTVIVACAIQMLDFMEYSLFTIFFPSYLQVAGHFTPANATRIEYAYLPLIPSLAKSRRHRLGWRKDSRSNSLRVAFQISGLFVAVGIKYTKNAHYWALAGPPLVILGQGVMIYLVDMGDGRHGSEAAFIASKVVSGVGRALWQTAAQVSVQAVVSRQEVAVATGIFQAANSVGAAIGTSISGAIWRNTLPDKLLAHLPEQEKKNALKIFQSIVVAQKYPVGTPARAAIDRSYRESQRILGIVATCVCAPNVFIMWFMRNVRLDEEDRKDEEGVDKTIAKIEQGKERE